MSLLLRARCAWRAHSTRVSFQPKRAPSLRLLPLPSQSQWLRRRDGAVRPAISIGSLRALSSAVAPPLSTASSASSPSVSFDKAARDALVDKLRPLCQSLYSNQRDAAQTMDELLATWKTQLSELLQTETQETPMVHDEIAQTYEQGIAIALKQREFDLAQALLTQMQTLGLTAHDELFIYQIRAVPLQWITRPRQFALEELRTLNLGPSWEQATLELVRTEEQPHYRKSEPEQRKFHSFIRDGVAQVLAEYETTVPKDKQTIAPYNAAVRAFAANDLPFTAMLRVLTSIPQDSPARRALNTETFVALLQGARWHDIPITLERLAASNVLRDLPHDSPALARTAALVWDQAMRSICNSYSDQFIDKRKSLDRRLLRDLNGIYMDVDAQLKRVFPGHPLAALEDEALLTGVYEIRVKTAAQLGLRRHMYEVLDEYTATVEAAGRPLAKSVLLKALEIFPSVGLMRIFGHNVARVRSHPDMLEHPEIVELTRAIEHLETNVIPPLRMQFKEIGASRKTKDTPIKEETDETVDTDEAANVEGGAADNLMRRELRRAQDAARKLKKRLPEMKDRVEVEIAHEHRMRAADKTMAHILGRLNSESDYDPQQQDLDVAVAIMNQYMTTANRFAAHMQTPWRELTAEQVMKRVSELLDSVVGREPVADDVSADDRAKMEQLFSLAIKTAALFWCEEDLNDLVRRKKTALGTAQLDADDYDRLVFMRVVQLDVDGAIQLLQEMHYAGVAPTPLTIHRVVIGALHKRYFGGDTQKKKKKTKKKEAKKKQADDVDDADEDEDTLEDTMLDDLVGGDDLEEDTAEEVAAAAWSSSPRRLEDMVGFFQEWYNLYRVKPLAKTVVPVFARLLAANKVWELKRLLQILESMDGGLTPATEFWLEKRLEAMGKSVDELRISSTRR